MEPILRKHLGIAEVIVPQVDTDKFGTFSGEIERPSDPITTLRAKIHDALEIAGETLGIGSEGSFGPDPQMPFVQAHHEVVMLIDQANNLEIIEHVVSYGTFFGRSEVSQLKDLMDFADKAQFPSHGLILKQIKSDKVINITKGIVTWDLLYTVAQKYFTDDTSLVVETDMRAHLNPSRMKVIAEVTDKLMANVNSLCPECQWPGFTALEFKPGLVCAQCGEPTKVFQSKIHRCGHCDYWCEELCTDGLHADPRFCDLCNP
ncbi:MAG TPA: DUF6671 family protein [Chryseosolibacter sp.]